MLIAELLIGCGLESDPRVANDVNNKIQEYYDRFEAVFNIAISDIPASFTTLEGSTIGICAIWTGNTRDYREITIDAEFWEDAEDAYKEELIFHELGHCYYYRVHTKLKYEDNCPMSLMYPTIFYKGCQNKYKDELYQELPYGDTFGTPRRLAGFDTYEHSGCLQVYDLNHVYIH